MLTYTAVAHYGAFVQRSPTATTSRWSH